MSPTPLLGRSRELELLAGHLDAALRGFARFVVLDGEAGIGKSRLVSETVLRARERGFDVVATAAYELEHARPFGPLVSAIAGTEALVGFQLQEHVVANLEGRAIERPVLLTLDDAHWSDAATLGAVASCVRRLSHLPFFVLLSARPLPRSPELDRLIAQADVVAVQPLDEEAVTELVAEIVGAAPGPALREAVAGASGNPFFVGELVDALRADGAIEVREGVAETHGRSIPKSLRISILPRMNSLTRPTLDTLRLASVLGSHFTVSNLSVVARKPSADLLALIDEAVRAGVLEERGDGLQFRHDLLREALYQDMPLSSRVALHLDCARTLAAAGAPPERVAPHFALGAAVGDAEAVDWLTRAGNDASIRNPGTALELYEQASRLMRPGDGARVRVNLARLNALTWIGRADEVVALARETLDAAGPLEEAALERALTWALFTRGDVDEALERGDAYVSRRDVRDLDRFPIVLWMAHCRAILGRPGARERAEQAMAFYERLEDARASVQALMILTTVLRYEGRTAEAVDRALEVVRLSRDGVRVIGPPGPWFPLARTYIEADRFDEAESVLREDMRRAEEAGLAAVLLWNHRAMGDLRYAAGEWDEAVAELEAADVLAQELNERVRSTRVQLALVAVHRNRLDEAAAHLDLASTALPTLDVPWVRSLWHEARGDVEAASTVLRDAVDDCGLAPAVLMPSLAFVDLTRLAMRTGDRTLADRATRTIVEEARRRDTPTARGNALRCEGLLDDDADTLFAAVAEYRSGPRPLELALGCEDAAAALARAGRTDEATHAFRDALEVFERLGAAWDVSRCQATARACGIKLRVRRARTAARTGWESLSPTERTVAGLAASGLSNPEIGRRLYISRRTVETHLSHVFSKLGLASRVELAGAVARLGDEFLQGGQQP